MTAIAITSDDKHVNLGFFNNLLQVWNISNAKQEKTFEGHTLPVQALTITKNQKYIVSSGDDLTIRV